MFLEPRLELCLRLPLFTVRNSVFEICLVLVFEHQTEPVDHFHLAGVQYFDFLLVGFVVLVCDAAPHPHLLLVILDRRARVPVDTFVHHLRLAVHPHLAVFVRRAVLPDQLPRHVDEPFVYLAPQILRNVLDRWVHHLFRHSDQLVRGDDTQRPCWLPLIWLQLLLVDCFDERIFDLQRGHELWLILVGLVHGRVLRAQRRVLHHILCFLEWRQLPRTLR